MRWISFVIGISLIFLALPASAQDRPGTRVALNPSISPGEVPPTPEMWFYEQYRNDYQDPKMAVRKKAEFRATQRQHRIAAMKWFGFSNARPHASPDPWHGDYSPGWRSNNSVHPFQWSGVGGPVIVLPRDGVTYLPY